ncbi:hypothetical protein GSU68_09900 [Rathayibacter sp. VKM Ac-2759]|uniref:hypothetical protein n=1 Tax=Rathayibacter sp. VKM Ac-2759 TaxID=2609252 RepID=UPI0013165B03|nr:hypothetical protein [Rathayibacter sp. VKM Ac-2759]QHC66841.1 hypothetical protein GSU68_09900 [Rathayibacter sp. VKM Ac-2759]
MDAIWDWVNDVLGLEPGSAADWVTGLLTFATLLVALLVLQKDRLKDARSSADGFVTWREVVSSRAVVEMPDWYIHVHGFNAGAKPIPFTMLMVKPGSPQHVLRAFQREPIQPGAEIETKVGFENDPSDSPLLLYFRDAHGKGWLRDLQTNRYVSRRQVKKWYRAHGDTGIGLYHFLFSSWNQSKIAKRMKEIGDKNEREHAAFLKTGEGQKWLKNSEKEERKWKRQLARWYLFTREGRRDKRIEGYRANDR